MEDAAAWEQLQRAVDAALWHYAEAVSGCQRDSSVRGPFDGRMLWLARLAGLRRLSAALEELDLAAARGALADGATYPAIANAAGMARQSAWKRYRSRRAGPADRSGRNDPEQPAAE